MSVPIPDYEKEFVLAIRKNLTQVVDDLDKKEAGLMRKISTLAHRFAFAIEDIEKKIRDDTLFRAWFAKDPGKQKIHENIAAKFIESLPTVSKFIQLGHNSLQLVGGAVMSRKDARSRGATSRAKSLDFLWETCGMEIYASHKYTKDGGGGQDNQYRDLIEFVREANESRKQNAMFLAIADGPYYSMRDTEAGVPKIQRLKELANQRNVFALSSKELEGFLENLCSAKGKERKKKG